MPGNRGKNLRSGDLNEEYGLFMLRLLGAVAPVPRTEDVGVDVFLTLLHEDKGRLSAGRTCLVQLKSNSVESIVFETKSEKESGISEYEWLRNLEYPLLIGQVSVGSKIRLYTTSQLLAWQIDNREAQRIEVVFGLPSDSEKQSGDMVRLGHPILEYDLQEAQSSEQRAILVEVLSSWVELLYENLVLAKVGIHKRATWKTNEKPKVDQYAISSMEPDSVRSGIVLREAALRVIALLIERAFHGKEGDIMACRTILDAIDRDCEGFVWQSGLDDQLNTEIDNLRDHRREYQEQIAEVQATEGGILLNLQPPT